jgi:predicted CoA-substrate-specific enzyme activase
MPVDHGGKLALGFDLGSVALKVVVTDLSGNLLERSYTRTQGQPVETTLRVLGEVLQRRGAEAFDLVAGTGTAGRLICQLLDVAFVNEVICQATAVGHLYPQVRTLIEMGGQDSKLIVLAEDQSHGQPMVDFTMNTNCAAGTGSFLDQQASRLGLRIEEEFGQLALRCKSPPRVAGRCSVFAKSDMIHLQQQGASVGDVVAGLCLGLARNLKSNLGRGMELKRPIAFCGGVAANRGVVRALEEVFELDSGELIVPECHAVTGALGAVLVSLKERGRGDRGHGRPNHGRLDLTPLDGYLEHGRQIGNRLPRLNSPSDVRIQHSAFSIQHSADGPIDAYLGLDVGSISTKVAVIDAENRVLAKIYLMTAGRPLEAVRRALRDIGPKVEGLVRIRGAASTGSGRYLTGDFIGADLVINEITAQATAAAIIDPEVDTIFEIGGQDSKYISLDRGVVVDFEMNHACAAGTGSFLEEQAERLGIKIEEQFGGLALSSQAPIRLGERCTVFMESDLLCYQQQRARTEDLVSGLCYSIVSNYINRVVGHRRIGERIFFQGGTAFNQGVVAAFEQVTGRKITVPPHHEVTGAIGAAALARRYQQEQGRSQSNFGGFELAEVQYEVRSFECEHCSNQCEINEVTVAGRDPLYYGSRCDRYNRKQDRSRDERIPNLFAERHRLLMQHAHLPAEKRPGRPTIGIPLALSNYQLLPFWGTLLGELGVNVVVSPASSQRTIDRGVEAVVSTPCFPVKVAHGHVLELIDRGVDYVWLPSVTALQQESPENPYNQLCPYVTAIPYQIVAAIESHVGDVKMLTPAVRFQQGRHGMERYLESLCGELGVSRRRLRRAIGKAWQAQDAFEEACRRRGREVLENLSPQRRAMVLVSRPYNGCDLGVNLDLPAKLRKLGVQPIPMDFLDLRPAKTTNDRIFQNMYWKYGQRILRAAELIREDPRLHAVYLSNFSCGPDSFLIGYFKRVMAPKPALVLEIDEHSAAAGVVTRLEAFLESLGGGGKASGTGVPPVAEVSGTGVSPVAHLASGTGVSPVALPPRRPLYPLPVGNGNGRTVYIPWMGDQCYALAAAFRACGQQAEVIPIGDQESIELGRRRCSGKECLPCIITAGDMIRVTQRPDFDPRRAAFFMPGGSGPCRFGQYNCMHKLLLNDLGLDEVPMVALSQDKEFYDQCKQLQGDPLRLGWYGACASDVLLKACLAIRPYESCAGDTDRIYQWWVEELCRLIETSPKVGQVVELLQRAAGEFGAVAADRSGVPSGRRPRIGIVGEIYVRHHTLANNDLIRQLEELGAETALAPFTEWIYYTNFIRMRQARREFAPRQWLSNFIQDRFQHKWHRQMSAVFEPLLGSLEEPPTKEVLRLAQPFLDSSFEGEAVLSVGKTVEFCHHGCHGVVVVMPFTCMPSTIVGGVLKKVTAALGEMPALPISYDGQQDPTLQTRLEAFIYQARAYQQRNGGHTTDTAVKQHA